MSDTKTVRDADVWRVAEMVAIELDKINANWLEVAMVAEIIKATGTSKMVSL